MRRRGSFAPLVRVVRGKPICNGRLIQAHLSETGYPALVQGSSECELRKGERPQIPSPRTDRSAFP